MPRSSNKGTPTPFQSCKLLSNTTTDLPSSLNNLSLNTRPTKSATTTSKPQSKEQIADSWDQEDDSDSSSNNDQLSALPVPNRSKAYVLSDYPSAPPPTPAAPQPKHFSKPAAMDEFAQFEAPHAALASATSTRSQPRQRDPNTRPETTMSSASRLIAGALGVKAPKRTEEQRQYDKAVKETERKRRDREKEDRKREEEERVRARAAVWDE